MSTTATPQTAMVEREQEQPQARADMKASTGQRFRQLLDQLKEAKRESAELKRVPPDLEAAVRRKVAEERWALSCETWRKVVEDFDERLDALRLPAFILPELLALENGCEVAYVLSGNPALCQGLADMTPEAAIRELKNLSAFVEQKRLEQLLQLRRGGMI